MAISVMAVAMAWQAAARSPVRPGDAATFWALACRETGSAAPSGGCYAPRDGWFIYYVQHAHGQALFRVPEADALVAFPAVVERLAAAPPGSVHVDVETGFQLWLKEDAARADAKRLLASIHQARLARTKATEPILHAAYLEDEPAFAERWKRVRHYHWNVVAEFLFLTGLIVFGFWPWLRNAGPWAWAWHWGLLPMLFLSPLFLGYCQLTFSSAGSSGGALYPWLLLLLPTCWTSLDPSILRLLPQPLAQFSQSPGPMLSWSRVGGVGPVAALVAGLLLGVVAFVLRCGRVSKEQASISGTRKE
jgi:hypothetical protein